MKNTLLLLMLVAVSCCFADPDWEIVIYTNSTVAYCQVTIDEIPAVEGDLVGAFIENECRGIGNIFVFEGNSYTTMNIQGTIPEIVSFQVWDQSINTICAVEYTTMTSPGYDIGYPPDYLQISAYSGNPINHYPAMNLPESFVIPEDIPTTYDFSEFCSDEDGDVLSVEMEDNPNIICNSNDLLVTLSSAENWFGITYITFWLSDGALSVHDSLEIFVTAVNDPPEVTDTYPELGYVEIEQFEPVSFAVMANDIDSAINYAWFLDSVQMPGTDYILNHTFNELGNTNLDCVIADEQYEITVSWNINVIVNPVNEQNIPDEQNFCLSPNPCSSNLNISWNPQRNSVYAIKIYDIKGRLCENIKLHDQQNSCSIDEVNNLTPGIYFLKIISNAPGKTLKFTVK